MMPRAGDLGTTLVELLVVLLLLGLLAGAGVGSMTSLREPEADASVHALRRARAQAIQRGVPILVRGDSVRTRFLPDGATLQGGAYGADTSRAGR